MLKVGTKAPNFTLKNQNDEDVTLENLKGQYVLLYFYPKDMTPGCTKEACAFRDYWAELKKAGVTVLGVSKDSTTRHKKFAENEQLPFDLLADTNATVLDLYEAMGNKSMYGKTFLGILRISYLIDKTGTIVKVYEKVKPTEHAEEVLNDVLALS